MLDGTEWHEHDGKEKERGVGRKGEQVSGRRISIHPGHQSIVKDYDSIETPIQFIVSR